MKFPEFVMTDIRENDDVTVVSESRQAAGQALLRFLVGHGHEICVLKRVESVKDSRGFSHSHEHFTVIGDQRRFDAWMTEALNRQAYREEPTIEYRPSLDAETVSRWAENPLRKELWTAFVSHSYDDEFTRGIPTIRRYEVFLRYFAPISPELKDSPELAAFREAGFVAACVTKEERL